MERHALRGCLVERCGQLAGGWERVTRVFREALWNTSGVTGTRYADVVWCVVEHSLAFLSTLLANTAMNLFIVLKKVYVTAENSAWHDG